MKTINNLIKTIDRMYGLQDWLTKDWLKRILEENVKYKTRLVIAYGTRTGIHKTVLYVLSTKLRKHKCTRVIFILDHLDRDRTC